MTDRDAAIAAFLTPALNDLPFVERIRGGALDATCLILKECPPFDLELAKRAHAHLSWEPDERAAQEQESARAHIEAIVTWLYPLIGTPEQYAMLKAEVAAYRDGYLQRLYAVLQARSQTASSFITGGSNFNVSRNRKKLDIERKREQEMNAWCTKAQLAIKAKLTGAWTPEQIDDELWRKLKKALDSNYASIVAIERGEMPGYRKASFSGGIAASVRTQHKAGNQTMVDRMLGYLRDLEATHGVQAIGAKNAVWGLHSASREAA